MLNLKELMISVTLGILLASNAGAQELYFRNKLFKGPSSGSWENMMVGLKETAKIFELEIREEGGAYLIGPSPETISPGQVVVDGKLLQTEPGATGPLVNLKELAEAAGLTYKPNRELGGIDVTKPAAKGGVSTAVAGGATGAPVYINKDDPGALVDLDALKGGGWVCMYMYKRGETDKGYKASYDQVDGFAQVKGVTLYKVNVGGRETPLGQRYPGMLPRLDIYRGRQWVQGYNGHSINGAAKNPQSTMDQLRKKWER